MTDVTDAPPAPADEDEPTSLLDFRPSGGMHIIDSGEKRRLRAPRMRDYRRLYELWRDLAEDLDRKSAELEEFLTRIVAESDQRAAAGQDRLNDEDRATDRRLSHEIREATEDAALRWWVECIRTLGVTEADRNLDEHEPEADLPVFLTGADLVTQAIQHWRSVPSRSGAR